MPLTAMVLRVHALETPARVPARPEYVGCRSWLQLLDNVDVGTTMPVLGDAVFAETANAIDEAMETAQATLVR